MKYIRNFVFNSVSNRIGDVIVSLFPSSVIDREFESRSRQTKTMKLVLCCFSAAHAALIGRMSKDWLDRNLDTVSRVRVICISADCCFSEASTLKIQLSVLV